MPRIAILFRTIDGPWGGGNSFLRSLKKSWNKQGVEVVDRITPAVDGVLINAHMLGTKRRLAPSKTASVVKTGHLTWIGQHLRRRMWRDLSRPPFVHRLDGIVRLYGRNDPYMDWAQKEINHFMDWTIYQSEFCRKSFAEEGLDITRSTVISNGVDIERFFPAELPCELTPLKILSVSWSSNINKGALYAVKASRFLGVEVTFIGNWPPGLETGRVRLIPPKNHEQLPDLLREHHALLHMAKNDPCSNVILEAMASGLPVIYHPSGGSPEIVARCGVPGEPDLLIAIEELRDRYHELRQLTLERRQQFSVDNVARAYLQVFEQCGRILLN